MDAINDFSSPFKSSSPSRPSVASSQQVMVTIPGREDDRVFTLAVDALRKLQRPQRNAVISLLLRWLELPPGRQAGLAIAVMPDLQPAEVAVLCGKSVRQLDRYEEYRALKSTLEDYLEPKRRRYSLPDEIEE